MENSEEKDYNTLLNALRQVVARFMTVRTDCSPRVVVRVLKDLADAYGGSHDTHKP